MDESDEQAGGDTSQQTLSSSPSTVTSMSHLHMVQIQDFKCFRGSHTFGPFPNYVGVIGSNGSGKSSFLEAISFGLGMDISELRVKKAADLLHQVDGTAPQNCLAVTLTFLKDDGQALPFSRVIDRKRERFFVNEQVVTKEVYRKKLAGLGHYASTINFTRFREVVEDDNGIKGALGLTQLLEKVSGSSSLKKDHMDLERKLKVAEAKFSASKEANLKNRHRVSELRKDIRNANNYGKWKEKLDEKTLTLEMLNLFKNSEDIKQAMEKRKPADGKELAKKLEDAQKKKTKIADKISKVSKAAEKRRAEASDKFRDLAKANKSHEASKQELQEEEQVLQRLKRELAHAEAESTVWNKQLEEYKQVHQRIMKNLTEHEAKRTKSGTYNMSKEEMSKYCEVMEKVNRDCREALTNKARISRELLFIKHKRDNIWREKDEVKTKASKKTAVLDGLKKDLELLKERIASMIESRGLKQKELDNYEQNKAGTEARKRELETHYCEIQNMLQELSHVKAMDDNRQKADLIMTQNDGVRGRLKDICEPIDKKYDRAITLILGKKMDTLIVDDLETLKRCVHFVVQNKGRTERFFPLHRLRSIGERDWKKKFRCDRPGVQPMANFMRYDNAKAKGIVALLTDKVLLCETVDDAKWAAYELEGGFKYTAVSLDGTAFYKNGRISWSSGGSWRNKCGKWDAVRYQKIHDNRKAVREELERLSKHRFEEFDKEGMSVDIEYCGQRIKVLQESKEAKEQLKGTIMSELDELDEKLRAICAEEEDCERKHNELSQQSDELTTIVEAVRIQELQEFCNRVRVASVNDLNVIRSAQLEWESEKEEYQQQISRINTAIDDMKQRLARGRYDAKQKDVEEQEAKARSIRESTNVTQGNITAAESDLKAAEDQRQAYANELGELQKEKRTVLDNIRKLKDQRSTLASDASQVEEELDSLLHKQHFLLHSCLVRNIRIPLQAGQLQDHAEFLTTPEAELSNYSKEELREMLESVGIDFQSLNRDFLEAVRNNEFERLEAELMTDRTIHLSQMKKEYTGENSRANLMKQLDDELRLQNELKEISNEMKHLQKQVKEMEVLRKDKFLACFQEVERNLMKFYKKVTDCDTVQAVLSVDKDSATPYNCPVTFNCVVPGKRWVPFECMSGGEKTLASMALLLAINDWQSPSFCLMDEIDSALDGHNKRHAAAVISSLANAGKQFFVVTHKNSFLLLADLMIGFSGHKDRAKKKQTSTRAFHLSLKGYDLGVVEEEVEMDEEADEELPMDLSPPSFV